MSGLKNHPLRHQLSNELHARPFPQIDAPAVAVFMALSEPEGAKEAHDAHLLKLLDHFGAAHPSNGSGHHMTMLGNVLLKWERHTEFLTYTLVRPESDDTEIEIESFFPKEWLASCPGEVMTSASVRLHASQNTKAVERTVLTDLHERFASESLSVAYVLNKTAAIATDFRTDAQNMVRFEVFPIGQVGRNRLGRIVQRLFEIEIYKQMSMLALPVAREVFADLSEIETQLTAEVDGLSKNGGSTKEALDRLLSLSAQIEELQSKHSYRFGATKAYGALVHHRIDVLREETLMERQTFAEFMSRRFNPALRTCEAAQSRLQDLSLRAARAADLLSTRVGVLLDEQNQKVLERMDERAGVQLRLQKTVEGLSVVAISYYAVQLLASMVAPLAKRVWDLDKVTTTGLLVIPVVLLVAYMIRRVRHRIEDKSDPKS